ncbi:MAG: prolyl oligopeptidase family serine peptidase [Planctomycetota bacterium]
MPRWSPDGARLAFVRLPGVQAKLPLIPMRPMPWSIWVSDANGARAIWHSRKDQSGSFPEWAADRCFHFAAADRIVFASEHDGQNHLYAVAAGGGAETPLTPGDGDVEEAILSTDRQAVIYTSNVATSDREDIDRRHLWRVAVEGGPPQQLTAGATLEWSPCAIGDALVCIGSTATSPAMPYLIRTSGREPIAAQAMPSDFPAAELIVPTGVAFQSADGLTVHGQLFQPRTSTGAAPALVFTHGGPPRQMLLGFHYMDYYHHAYAMNQYLASRGYVVLSVNYRLGIMYGRQFRQPEHAGWRGSAEYQDVLAGARYLATLPAVDAKRIGLWGGSYGGLLTALGLARNSDVFAAGADFHGVHDWSAFLPRWENDPMAAPDAKQALELAFASSPNASIDHWRSPVLLVQGDDDRNVPASQTVNLIQLLREHHVAFESIFLPDEIHDFLLFRTWLTTYAATADFFDRVLKRGEAVRSE